MTKKEKPLKTNHKWNVLKIMRFYNRIEKDFNARVYLGFFGPVDHAENGSVQIPSESEISLMIRRYVANGWVVRRGAYVVMTIKGAAVLLQHEQDELLNNIKKRRERYDEHAEYIKTIERVRTRDGSYRKIKI